MSNSSSIEWTDATWNVVTGCDRVSPGCAHCYALDLAERLKAMGQERYQRDGDPRTSGPGFGVTIHEDRLDQPLRMRRGRRIFVNSMSDLFHEEIPLEFVGRVFNIMGTATQHTFQVLTKRPERMVAIVSAYYHTLGLEPFPNVWLGVSIENRRFVHRADLLRATPAAVRFISAEPLLGPLVAQAHDIGEMGAGGQPFRWDDDYAGPELDLTGIDQLIVGGESGPRHRRMDPQWARDLRDAAVANGTCFFFKQWGGRTPKAGGRALDGRTWDEEPARPRTAVPA